MGIWEFPTITDAALFAVIAMKLFRNILKLIIAYNLLLKTAQFYNYNHMYLKTNTKL